MSPTDNWRPYKLTKPVPRVLYHLKNKILINKGYKVVLMEEHYEKGNYKASYSTSIKKPIGYRGIRLPPGKS